MKLHLLKLLLFLFSILFVACTTSETAVEKSNNDRLSVSEIERPIPYPVEVPNGFQRAVDEQSRTTTGIPGENYWQNEGNYILYAEIDTENHKLYGRAEVTYYNHSPDDLEIIVVELAQNLHKEGTPKRDIEEVTGGKTMSLIKANGLELDETTMQQRWFEGGSGFIINGTRLYIFPDEDLKTGESMDFEFEWIFNIPREGASGRMGRSRDNLYMLAYWYPQIAVYDDVFGWMDDHFLGNAEFYHKFSNYEMHITMPENWLVMGTGEFLNPEEVLNEPMLERFHTALTGDEIVTVVDFDETEQATKKSDNGTLTWSFSAEKVRDVAFSATLESRWESSRSSVGDLDGDGEENYTRINTFYRDTAPLWEEQTSYAQHATTFLSDYTAIPYPWPHMTSVEGTDIIGGGMEFPMITLIGDYNNAGAVRLYGVTAHEIAHMWIPMIVSTNERRYTWLDEGHTSFHTQQANVDKYGKDRFSHSELFAPYLRIAGSDFEGEMMRWSDFHIPGPAYGVASYPKPASVLTALRGILGDDLFLEAHREFMKRWSYKHPYPWDFFNTIEDVTGKDLSWFWRSWYYETWTLDQAVADVQSNENGSKIVIEDRGKIPMPILLELTFDNGSTQTVRKEVDHWLEGHRTKIIYIEHNEPLKRVKIDPAHHFPDIDRSNNLWETNK